MHTPQAPLTHTEPLHATVEPQVPIELHVCTPEPVLSHCVVPGVHMPPHIPPEQAWPVQAEPAFIQVPVAPQTCGCCPLH
jgi:hypothetical protein